MSSSPPPSSSSAMAARGPSRGCSACAAPALPFAASTEGPTSGSLAGPGPASASALRLCSASCASVLAMRLCVRARAPSSQVKHLALTAAWQSRLATSARQRCRISASKHKSLVQQLWRPVHTRAQTCVFDLRLSSSLADLQLAPFGLQMHPIGLQANLENQLVSFRLSPRPQ